MKDLIVYKGFRWLGYFDLEGVYRLIDELEPSAGWDLDRFLRVEFPDGSHLLVSRDQYPDHQEVHFLVPAHWKRLPQAVVFINQYFFDHGVFECKGWISNLLGQGPFVHYSFEVSPRIVAG